MCAGPASHPWSLGLISTNVVEVLVSKDIFIHPTACVETSNIGDRTRIWQFVVILKGAQIGTDCNICSHVFIEQDVFVGDNCTIKCGVQLWNGIKIGSNVFIGPNATFTNDKYPASGNRSFNQLCTIIEDNAVIGAGAVILPGVTIGRSSLVGAGAVVTKTIPSGRTVVGNPAREISRSSH